MYSMVEKVYREKKNDVAINFDDAGKKPERKTLDGNSELVILQGSSFRFQSRAKDNPGRGKKKSEILSFEICGRKS